MDSTSTPAWPGRPSPLGATWDGEGTNVALFAPAAESVEVCLFDDAGGQRRVPLTETTHQVWHGYLPGVGPGQRYGFRVDGPFDAGRGYRWNPSKLLADPYALAFDGDLVLDDAVFGYPQHRDDAVQDHRDSAPFVPKSVVVHDDVDWSDDVRPATAWADTVLYELHVKGMTMRHPDVPPELRGTYAGLAHPAIVEHLQRLGVTAVELMPVHHFLSEPHVLRQGLVNYWGYNTHGFFAPHAAYSSTGSLGGQVREFKAMVRSLHAAGIEVILDVVYNHTAEGDELGPTLSLRGIDNPAYYRLREDDQRRYVDYTGTGNTMDARQPHVLALLMDSLRYWVTTMGVDGFRFDLASALARSDRHVDRRSAFFAVIGQDPVVSAVKLIAEPWDVAEGGYQVGRFPPGWSEWNGKYRDGVRDYWRGGDTGVAELASRLAGSSDLYQAGGRLPSASINFITSHDGFSMRDLVSYDHKHNHANGEHNRDGDNDNRSWNCGVEGETDDTAILELRSRQVANLLVTLLLSTGVPMLRAGDELGHTQRGNNNAYCQDNEISWLDWDSFDSFDSFPSYVELVSRLLALRRAHPVLRQQTFFHGRSVTPGGAKDVAWFAGSGAEMTEAEFRARGTHSIGMYFSGSGISARGPHGEVATDDSFLLLLHAGDEPWPVTLPAAPWASSYVVELRTDGEPGASLGSGASLELSPRSAALLRVVD